MSCCFWIWFAPCILSTTILKDLAILFFIKGN
jgi:hypothetical protein